MKESQQLKSHHLLKKLMVDAHTLVHGVPITTFTHVCMHVILCTRNDA